MKKLDLNKKESWRKEIIWLRSPFVTCQYPEGFQAILNHEWENSSATNLARNVLISTFFRGSKSIKNRYRFCTIWLVGLEEKIIDKDFTQSYWLALQILGTTEPDFYRGSATSTPWNNFFNSENVAPCWGLIFAIFRRSCPRDTRETTRRDVTVCKTRCR